MVKDKNEPKEVVVVKLAGREMPRRADGNVDFKDMEELKETFSDPEIVALVNRCIYQQEYQRESHKKRGKIERDNMKVLRQKMVDAGLDPKAEVIRQQLEGKR